jgi:Response regulators consisting of a CheY-like receiver domain and a winged-helix DNA-binding domain
MVKMKILLAEDEKELSNALVMLLSHNNYVVDAVYDGEDALSYAQEIDYDIIILDIMMPKLNGYQVLSKLREKKL